MKDPVLKEIGLRLQLIRKRLNLLQKEFAKMLDISNASLSEMEAGNAKPRFELIYNITRKFKVNVNYLLHGEGEIFMSDEISRQSGLDIRSEYLPFFKDFLYYFNQSPLVRTAMMNYFRTYILEKENLIEKDIRKTKASASQEQADKNDEGQGNR
ncbi:MAG: helix-turn-helix transcriptional regulator [Candidatus Aminicenantes bacterium]|nr:MAG: helix-turn-helix transcriptional regulator [Candidatus Aminicenantes bacterium]